MPRNPGEIPEACGSGEEEGRETQIRRVERGIQQTDKVFETLGLVEE